jgi:hypothetical protein
MKKPTKSDSQLLASLRVLSGILKADGSVLEQHVLLRDKWAIANNGVIGAGEPILEDLTAAPNGFLLKEALAKCGASFSLTQLPQSLSIKAGKFKALIPCMPPEDIHPAFPDPAIAQLDDRLKASLSAVAPLALDENSVVTASVLINSGTVTATDRKVIIQHWHGIDLPPMLTLPKALLKPLTSNSKKLTGFGFSKSSCTFHYEDNSWLKTQYFADTWPDVNSILNKSTNPHNIPDDFYNAIEALEPFSETGFVYCDSNVMRSHDISDNDKGASYEVYGLPKGPVLNIKQMKMIKPMVKTVDFMVPHHSHYMMLWFGEGCRGAVAGRV